MLIHIKKEERKGKREVKKIKIQERKGKGEREEGKREEEKEGGKEREKSREGGREGSSEGRGSLASAGGHGSMPQVSLSYRLTLTSAGQPPRGV